MRLGIIQNLLKQLSTREKKMEKKKSYVMLSDLKNKLTLWNQQLIIEISWQQLL